MRLVGVSFQALRPSPQKSCDRLRPSPRRTVLTGIVSGRFSRYRPRGKVTMPPPLVSACFSAASTAAVSSARPLPSAPNFRTSSTVCGHTGRASTVSFTGALQARSPPLPP